MPKLFRIPFILSLVFLAPFSGSYGQSADEEPTVSLDFKTMAWDRYSDANIYYQGRNKEVKLQLRKLRRSRPYHYNGPATLVFYTKEKDAEGQLLKVPVASVTFKQETKDPILLFIKNPNPEDKRRFITWEIDDNTSDFPYGAYQLFNLSKEQIRGRIGDQPFLLPKTGDRTILKLSGDERNVMSVIQVIWDGSWETASSSIWTFKPTERNLVFILSSDNPNYSFFDVKLVPESERKTDLDITMISDDQKPQGN